MSSDAVIRLESVNHHYDEGGDLKQVLFDINLEVQAGEVVFLVGPSGCGKTTLLTLIGGLRQLQSGRAWVLNTAMHEADSAALIALRRRIGFVFQQHNLVDYLTARQNVQMSLQLQAGMSRKRAEQTAGHMLASVGLQHRADAHPNQLSGGEKQRVSIARALVHRPSLILADEPTAALDSHVGREVITLVRDLAKKQDCPVIVVTHDNRIMEFADRVIAMEDGRIIPTSQSTIAQAFEHGTSQPTFTV